MGELSLDAEKDDARQVDEAEPFIASKDFVKAKAILLVEISRKPASYVNTYHEEGKLPVRVELLGARQGARAKIATMALNDALEAGPGHELHDLREQSLACVHNRSSGTSTRETTQFLENEVQIGTR